MFGFEIAGSWVISSEQLHTHILIQLVDGNFKLVIAGFYTRDAQLAIESNGSRTPFAFGKCNENVLFKGLKQSIVKANTSDVFVTCGSCNCGASLEFSLGT